VLFKQRQRTIFPILRSLRLSPRSVPLASRDKLIRIKTVPAYKKLACTFIDLGRNLSARCPLWVKRRHDDNAAGCPLYPKSGNCRLRVGCPLCAKSGHARHSIMSSARPSISGGTVRPRALAVLRLMTNSYLFGNCAGKSAGFAPLSTRSTYDAPSRHIISGLVP
jgi:hypothetical protein